MNKKKQPRAPLHHANRDRPLGSARPAGHAKTNYYGSYAKDGVYSNQRFVHSCSSLIGAKVTVETVNGGTFEGIFRTFSPQLELTIELVHQVDKDDPEKITEDSIRQTMVFPVKDIIRCSAIDTDLSYASKDGFRTDAQISNCNGETPMRELEQWMPEGVDAADLRELSLDNANGWRAEDMFEKNEREFNVKSTYSSKLEGYTVPLKVDDTKEYRELEAKAEILAREIEGNQSNRSNIELEYGDEEETFSAVVRPDKDDPSNDGEQLRKYVPPARRHQNNYNHSGRGDYRSGPRQNNPTFNNHHHSGSSPPGREPLQSHSRGPRNEKEYQKSPSMSPHGSSPSPYSSRDHQNNDSRYEDHPRSAGGNSQSNGNRRSHHYGQGNGRDQGRTEHEGSSNAGPRQHQQNRGGGFPAYPQLSRSHKEQVSDLKVKIIEKDFHSKFLLTTASSSVTLDLSGLKVKPQVQHATQHLSEIRARSGSPQDQQTSPKPANQQEHAPQQQQQNFQQMPVRPETTAQYQQIPVRPETSTGTNFSLQRQQSDTETSMNQETSSPALEDGSQARQPSPLQITHQQSPQHPSSPHQGEKKSSLNPLAKEFILNPNAKVFVPGNGSGGSTTVSSTPPQRPITPATPMSYPSNAITPHQQFIQGAPAVPSHIYQYGGTPMSGPVYHSAQHGAPFPFPPNGNIGSLPPQSQHQHQRFRPSGNNQGPRQQGVPMDISQSNPMIVQGVPPLMTGGVQGPQAPHPQGYIQQFQPQSHQFNATASMMQANAMLMRIPPAAMNPMMVAQSPTTPPMSITTIGAIMENAAGWMQQHQGQAPLPHIAGVPPPQGNPIGPGHLGQPPPPQPQIHSGVGPQQHNQAQVAAVQAAVQAHQQQVAASNGNHTPAPSPGPMSVYSPSGPQFSPGYPGMLMLPPGAHHPGMIQPTMMPGQGVPHPSHMQMHQFAMHQHQQMVPGQQNAPHMMLQP